MTTLTAFLDLAVCPVSFDAIVFLVKAKIEQQQIGATRMHVVIVPDPNGVAGMFRDKTSLYDAAEMHWRLWNILIPAAQLFGASVTLACDWLMAKRLASDKDWKCFPEDWDQQSLKNRRHLIGDVITAARAGTKIPCVRASTHARRSVKAAYEMLRKPVVTMTLRSTYLPERNSDRAAWEEARRYIEGSGFAVVTLEDTRVALTRGQGYGELNLDLRAACYEEAALNVQSNNGSASLCWFGSRPWMMFDAGVGASAEEWRGLFVRQGLALGDSWPWSDAQQRIVYKPSTAENIIEAFKAWREQSNMEQRASVSGTK